MKKNLTSGKRTGIWINQSVACIISLPDAGEPVLRKIKSNVESIVRFKGEGKMYARFGNTFINDQEKKQRRQQAQRRRFYKKIAAMLKNNDHLLIFGPGPAKDELRKEYESDTTTKGMISDIISSDRMTQNQMKEFVRNYFEGKDFKKRTRHKLTGRKLKQL